MPSSASPRVVTLRDVAHAVGVSPASVSLALRNDPRISEARRLEIQAAAQKMAYRPNPSATALAHAKRNAIHQPIHATLAWLNLWSEPEKLRQLKEFDAYWRGALAAAEKAGYRLEEFVANDRLPVSRLEKILLARGITGLLLPPHRTQPEWERFDWGRFSIVRFGRSVEHPAAYVVTADHVANMMVAMAEIQRRGYARIAFVAEPADKRWYLFEAGFLMAQQKIPESRRLPIFRVNKGAPTTSQQAMEAWLKKYKPDAVVTSIAETPGMLRKAGYRVPADIGIAVMSVLDGNADSGIDQNPEEIGRAAVETLIGLIYGRQCGIPEYRRDILVRGRWVDGNTMPSRSSLEK
ncbi:MAG: LacI family DNA-binding transcriptional regulator [Verrucomicrobia bacterium]|nr:LacI family DNA-binding transcriptional regulator [Verrucomicrobiota bacterium]